MVTPGATKEGPDGKPVVSKFATHRVIKPGVIFDVTSDTTSADLIRLKAARAATAQDEALYAARGGVVVKPSAASTDELTGAAASAAASITTGAAGAPGGPATDFAAVAAKADADAKAADEAAAKADADLAAANGSTRKSVV